MTCEKNERVRELGDRIEGLFQEYADVLFPQWCWTHLRMTYECESHECFANAENDTLVRWRVDHWLLPMSFVSDDDPGSRYVTLVSPNLATKDNVLDFMAMIEYHISGE